MTRLNLGAAIVLAVGLVIASVLIGGIYETRSASENAAFLWRINRFTGSIVICSPVSHDPHADPNVLAPQCFDVPFKNGNSN